MSDYHIAKFLCDLTPDDECGAEGGFGWHGLYVGDMGDEDPAFSELPLEDQERLRSSKAAIVYCDGNTTECSLFSDMFEAEDIWNEIVDECSDWEEDHGDDLQKS